MPEEVSRAKSSTSFQTPFCEWISCANKLLAVTWRRWVGGTSTSNLWDSMSACQQQCRSAKDNDRVTVTILRHHNLQLSFDSFKILTKPGEVDADFLAKVFSDVVERLILEPSSPSSPVLVENLAGVQRFGVTQLCLAYFLRSLDTITQETRLLTWLWIKFVFIEDISSHMSDFIMWWSYFQTTLKQIALGKSVTLTVTTRGIIIITHQRDKRKHTVMSIIKNVIEHGTQVKAVLN